MIKSASFADFGDQSWPSLDYLKPYFLAPKGQEWFNHFGNDTAGFTIYGANGTEHLEGYKGRIDVHLLLWGDPEHGVFLMWRKTGGGFSEFRSSKGDPSLDKKWTRTLHGDAMPLWLYIPFAEAWKAVQEFIETDGELPKSIAWINNNDLPEYTFPAPHDIVLPGEKPARVLTPEEAVRAIALGQGKV